MKYPAPPTDEPACYPFAYAGESCLDCQFHAACASIVARWETRRSLSELLVDAEKRIRAAQKEDPLGLYKRLYEKHFGRCPRVAPNAKNAKLFASVARLCRDGDVDPALYITAQMSSMKPWLDNRERNLHGIGFQPNMLSPKNGRRRYNAYVSAAKRRYGRADNESFEGTTPRGQLLMAVTVDETAIGSCYCAAWVSGHAVDWPAAVETERPGLDWRAVTGDPAGGREAFKRASVLQHEHGRDSVALLYVIAQLRAAVSVARGYAHDLPDRIGLKDHFSWPGLAALLARLYAPTSAAEHDLSGIPGRVWGSD